MRLTNIAVAMLFIAVLSCPAFSSPMSDLIFKNHGTLSQRDKDDISSKYEYAISPDGASVVDELGKPIEFEVREADLNGDRTNEIVILLSNPYLFGNTGRAVNIFTKNAGSAFRCVLDVPASDIEISSHTVRGYKDLILGTAGEKRPVWCWNGEKYAFHHAVSREDVHAQGKRPSRSAEGTTLIRDKQRELREAVTEYNKWNPVMIDSLTRENLVKLFEARLLRRPVAEYEVFLTSGNLATLNGVIVPPAPALPQVKSTQPVATESGSVPK